MAISPNDAAMLQALGEGVEAARAEAQATWGRERLPLLLPDDLRAKMHSQTAKWAKAYQEAWQAPTLTRDHLDAVQRHAAGMRNMYPKLAASASEAGHRPLAPDVWEFLLADGSVAAFVRTNDEAAKVVADGRFVSVYTMHEVGSVIDALPEALKVAKEVFVGSKFQYPRGKPEWYKTGADEIPF